MIAKCNYRLHFRFGGNGKNPPLKSVRWVRLLGFDTLLFNWNVPLS